VLLSLPTGPTMILCIRSSLARGVLSGLCLGAGSAAADAIYGVLAGYGIFAVESFMIQHRLIFHGIGSLVLILIGVKVFFEKIKEVPLHSKKTTQGLSKLFFSTFLLTLTSPLTGIGVSALCASFGLAQEPDRWDLPWVLGSGLFLGACMFWLGFSFLLSSLRKKIKQNSLRMISRISGGVLILLGLIIMLISFLFHDK